MKKMEQELRFGITVQMKDIISISKVELRWNQVSDLELEEQFFYISFNRLLINSLKKKKYLWLLEVLF